MTRNVRAAFAALAMTAGCGRSSVPVNPEAAVPEPASPVELAPLPYEVQLTGGADARQALPLVITLHGRGSDPTRFQKFFTDLPLAARLVHLEAPVEEHDGRAWFSFRGKSRATLTAEVDELADRAVLTTERLLAQLPTVGRPALVGFSQGSMVVYTMLVRHPTVYRRAVPVAGAYFGTAPSAEREGDRTVVVAMHGMKDPVMNPGSSAMAVEALRGMGFEAELRTFPEAVHWIASGELEAALHAELARDLPASVSGDPATGG